MQPIQRVLYFSTVYFIIFVVLSQLPQTPFPLLLGLFSLSPFIMIYLTFRVLTGGIESDITFEQSFYEDRNDIKRVQSGSER